MDVLIAGTYLWKVRSFSKRYRRKYFIANKSLGYEPSLKIMCRNHPRSIDLRDILDVRSGWQTDTFNRFENKVLQRKRLPRSRFGNRRGRTLVNEACCFSIVYGETHSSLDLIAKSPQEADLWVRALRHSLTVMRGVNQDNRFMEWLSGRFKEADRDGSGHLHLNEVVRLLMQLNVKMPRKEVHRIFNLADTDKHTGPDGEPSLDCEEFNDFYFMLMKRPEVDDIYHKYARSASEMTALELQSFLKEEQGMAGLTLEECQGLIDTFEPSDLKSSGRISIPGFSHLLWSDHFQVFNKEHRTVYQDMSQPLSSYFIATSHNTYLLGRQVVAESSIEGYVEALRRGCRCIEIDCWDGPDGEPVVTHGYALTSKLIFREVLKDAILPNAFTHSQYPLILSLENHCTPAQQKRLAFHITDVFGDLLYVESVSPDMKVLPSPEELKQRIVIKGRKLAAASELAKVEMDSLVAPRAARVSDTSTALNGEAEALAPNSEASQALSQAPLEKVTDQDLSDLVNICQGTHFHDFKQEGKCYEMVSLSESKARKLQEKSGEDFVAFNALRLSRIYPSGLRTGSTNYQPWHFWNTGCQMVALNYQGHRRPVFINEAKFQDNGGCGFVLKPDFLRLPDFHKFAYNPTVIKADKLNIPHDRKRLVEIRVISGQNLPKPEGKGLSDILDPYVKVKIIGHPIDFIREQTHVVNDNGLNPQWDCTFQFVVNFPELAFLFLVVKCEITRRQHAVVGAHALPLTSLAPGYRHVPLLDMKRRLLEPATLFIHTSVREVPQGFDFVNTLLEKL